MKIRRVTPLVLAALAALMATSTVTAVPTSAAVAVADSAALAAPSAPGAFVPVEHASVLNTVGGPRPQVAPQATVKVTVAGAYGVPSTAAAVVLNVSATNGTTTGYVTVWPDGQPRPTASNVNYVKDFQVSNLATVAVGAGGQVDFYNGSAGRVDLLAGLRGYYLGGTATDPGMFVSMAPQRLLDTRHGTGAPTHAVAAAGTVDVAVGGAAASGVPSDAKAVVLNVTAVAPTKSGFVTVYPTGGPRPTASNLNHVAGRTVPNLVTVALGSSGRVSLYNGSSGTVQLVADVAGYYIGGTATQDGAFVPVVPARILDTRIGQGAPVGPVRRDANVGLQTLGAGGIPLAGVSAVAMNVTVTSPTRQGVVGLVPTAENNGFAADITHIAGQTIANSTIQPPGICSKLQIVNFSGGSSQFLVDVAGYFIDTSGPALTDPAKPAVHALGANRFGDLGNGATAASSTPTTVLNLRDAKAVSGGELGLTNDGNVFAWGHGNLLQLQVDESLDQGYGNCSLPSQVPLFVPATQVAGSADSGFALTDQGVFSWGRNDEGQLGRDIIGSPQYFQPEKISALSDGGHAVLAIGAGMAIRDDHTLWTWGPNDKGQLGTGSTEAFSIAPAQVTALGSTVQSIAQYGQTNYARLANGTVWAMGDNAAGALGNGSTVTTTPSTNVPVQVSGVGGTGVLTALRLGPASAVLANHTVVTWGNNAHGRLGIGTTTGSSAVPVAVDEPAGMPDVASLASGPSHLVALGTDGTVWAWGSALGTGRSADSGTPTQVAGLAGATAIAAGIDTTYAVTSPAP